MSQLKNAAFPQLVVNGSNSRGLTTAPFKSNVDRLIFFGELLSDLIEKLPLATSISVL